MSGTAKKSVNPHPITTTSTRASRTGSSTAASIAPATANANAAASTVRFDHAAKVGRERGRLSPIPVLPARATLAGRRAASGMLCTAITTTEIPMAAPTIAYWTNRDPVAPAIPPTRRNSEAMKTGG